MHIGENSRFISETTQKQDFNQKTPEKTQAAIEAKMELRKAHFSFGSSTLAATDAFTTTNMEKQSKIKDAQHSPKVFPDRTIHIVYGRDVPIYQSMTKDTMVSHSVGESYKVKQSMVEQGKQVRKHNFELGFDDKRTEEFELSKNSKSGTILPVGQNHIKEVKRNHFEIGSKFRGNDYGTISKMA